MNNETRALSRVTQSAFRWRLSSAFCLSFIFLNCVEALGQDEQLTVAPANPSLLQPQPKVASEYELIRSEASRFEGQFQHISKVVQLVRPAAVHIETLGPKTGSGPRRVVEAGAGVLFSYRNRRFVLTNRHVIDPGVASDIRIQLADGRFFYPIRVWTDPGSDLAVLESSDANLPACEVGRSSQLNVGDFVIAIGSPFGLGHSVSYGIVSAKGRRDLQLGDSGVRYQDFIQTDAAINPGNSGGPLINLSGELVGINTAIASNSGSNEGIGFTIPSDMAIKIAHDLVDHGQVRRGFLGVSLDSSYSPEAAESLGLNSVYGARVTTITRGSPAELASLSPGDVILKFDEQVVQNDSHLVQIVSMTEIGSPVEVEIYRGGQTRRLKIKITDRAQFSRSQ